MAKPRKPKRVDPRDLPYASFSFHAALTGAEIPYQQSQIDYYNGASRMCKEPRWWRITVDFTMEHPDPDFPGRFLQTQKVRTYNAPFKMKIGELGKRINKLIALEVPEGYKPIHGAIRCTILLEPDKHAKRLSSAETAAWGVADATTELPASSDEASETGSVVQTSASIDDELKKWLDTARVSD